MTRASNPRSGPATVAGGQPVASEDLSLRLLAQALPQLQAAFRHLPPAQETAGDAEAMAEVLRTVAARMADNYPYFHPLYAGQMLKPPHPLARAAYALAMWINPNNHAQDGGRASSRMEAEAVREIAAIFGWTAFLGHLTGGGVMANLEALWIAGQLAPGKRILASEQAHYTHGRISALLGLPFTAVAAGKNGALDLSALESELDRGNVGAVVVTVGATSTGALDPLPETLALQRRYGFRIHVDAAYGGYFALAANLSPAGQGIFAAMGQADSIAIDPHKHGLQPYGCGCILFRDPAVGRFYRHDSPYTYFTSDELHLGEISLECSRAGASAVALWATHRLLPPVRGGAFAANLARSREAALSLHRRLIADPRFLAPIVPELDIVVWAVRSGSIAESSRLARAVFAKAAALELHLALADLPTSFFEAGAWTDPPADRREPATVTCLRSVLMKPEHLDWLEAIWSRLSHAVDEALAGPAQSGF